LSIKTKLIAGVGSLALVAGGMAIAAPAASAADQTLVNCGTGTRIVALLNPTLGSSDAKYVKAAVKRNDSVNSGKYHLSLTGAEDLGPSTVDATSCSVNAGIRTDNAATNAGTKLNPFDNQTNGQATLSMTSNTPFVPAIVGSTAGSATCNRSDPAVNGDYPQSYPLQGKLIFKFSQADAAAKQIQLQAYTRLGSDPADPDVTHITVRGTVIKGPGVGGDVTSTFGFGAAFDTKKNLNLLDCVNDNSNINDPRDGNASLATLIISPADGSDVGTTVDPFLVSIPA